MLGTSDAWWMSPIDPVSQRIILKIVGFLKIQTDLQGICIKCSAHPLWVIANKIESFTMNDSVICFLSDMFMAAHAYLHIGTYLYTMCIIFNQYSKSFYISRYGCFCNHLAIGKWQSTDGKVASLSEQPKKRKVLFRRLRGLLGGTVQK